jgi:hypothetical protein
VTEQISQTTISLFAMSQELPEALVKAVELTRRRAIVASTGKSVCDRPLRSISAPIDRHRNRLRENSDLSLPIKLIWVVQMSREK